jgi:hypothetical protein
MLCINMVDKSQSCFLLPVEFMKFVLCNDCIDDADDAQFCFVYKLQINYLILYLYLYFMRFTRNCLTWYETNLKLISDRQV